MANELRYKARVLFPSHRRDIKLNPQTGIFLFYNKGKDKIPSPYELEQIIL